MLNSLLKSLEHNSVIDDILVSGLSSFDDLLRVVQQLPYGRNENRFDPELVWVEQKGTCSSKHAFLKKIADEQSFDEVKLVMGIYKMNAKNTPGIGDGLENSVLDYIPEAHCYLSIKGERIDITFPESDIRKLMPDVIEEQFINWEDIGEFKVAYHKEYIRKWREQNEIDMTFDEIWDLRESLILKLSS